MYQTPCTLFLFNDQEKSKILFNRSLIEYRIGLSIFVGVLTTVAVFFIQYPWAGQQHLIHVYATYGAIPAGIAAGIYTWHMVELFIKENSGSSLILLKKESSAISPAGKGLRSPCPSVSYK